MLREFLAYDNCLSLHSRLMCVHLRLLQLFVQDWLAMQPRSAEPEHLSLLAGFAAMLQMDLAALDTWYFPNAACELTAARTGGGGYDIER